MPGVVSSAYNLDQLASGAVRVAYAPTSVAVPTNIADVINMVAQSGSYPLKTGWLDFGATTDAASYSRGIESEELEIQQEKGAVLEEITDVPRSLTFPVAKIDDQAMKIVENSSVVEAIAAGANKGAQQRVALGSVENLDTYRVVFIGIRPKKAGIVTEPGGATRGRMAMLALFNCSLAADETEFEFDKGSLWSGDVTFNAFPVPGRAVGQEHGDWYYEAAGTISAV